MPLIIYHFFVCFLHNEAYWKISVAPVLVKRMVGHIDAVTHVQVTMMLVIFLVKVSSIRWIEFEL